MTAEQYSRKLNGVWVFRYAPHLDQEDMSRMVPRGPITLHLETSGQSLGLELSIVSIFGLYRKA